MRWARHLRRGPGRRRGPWRSLVAVAAARGAVRRRRGARGGRVRRRWRGAPQATVLALEPQDPSLSGTVTAAFTPGEPGIYLQGSGPGPLPSDQVYELWVIEGDTPAAAVCVRPGDDGSSVRVRRQGGDRLRGAGGDGRALHVFGRPDHAAELGWAGHDRLNAFGRRGPTTQERATSTEHGACSAACSAHAAEQRPADPAPQPGDRRPTRSLRSRFAAATRACSGRPIAMSRTGWTPRSARRSNGRLELGRALLPSSRRPFGVAAPEDGDDVQQVELGAGGGRHRGGEGRRLGGRLGAVDAAGDLRREGGAGRAGEHHRTGRVAEHVLRDPAHADRPAEQAAVGSETHEVGVTVARLGHEHLIGVAGEDPRVGDDPEPLRLRGGSLESAASASGSTSGIVRPVGLDDVDDVEGGTERRGDPGALASRLLARADPSVPIRILSSFVVPRSRGEHLRSTICRMPPCR